jgi:preprotein translocase subunit SecG
MEILNLALNIALVLFAVALIIVVLAQKSKSAGLGSAFGSEASAFSTRGRAASREAKLQKLTVIFAILVGAFAIALLILSNFLDKPAAEETTSFISNLLIK